MLQQDLQRALVGVLRILRTQAVAPRQPQETVRVPLHDVDDQRVALVVREPRAHRGRDGGVPHRFHAGPFVPTFGSVQTS
jgi:hypothetical protein